MSGREEGFLSRWSRRKRGELPDPDAAGEPVVEAVPPAVAEAAEAPEAAALADLPPIESLTEASDFTGFLRPGVPAPLRQAALRRAWTLDPAIRDFIGPADYAWDYNAPDGVPGFALQLGGDVTRMLAQAIGALDKLMPPEAEPGEAPQVALATVEERPPEAASPEVAEPEVAALEGPTLEAPPVAVPAPPLAASPVPAVPPRRHGRAMPV